MITGLAMILVCALYYYFWMTLHPRWGGYTIRSQVIKVDINGANTHRLLRVPNAELDEFDANHDELGRELTKKTTDNSGGSVLIQQSSGSDGGNVRDGKEPYETYRQV